ncbi:4Fe-4S dicluster domain-containing protein [Soehngenia saccharolytica]|nr:4Fe-4S dicluster domain-containing protein [Soehngenia saccharolytica]
MIEDKLTNKNLCTGCHACMNICPQDCVEMKFDEEGFLYPRVNIEYCIQCNKCVNICPSLKKLPEAMGNEMLIAYACQAKDDKIRLISSSGGIFSLIAQEVISNEGIVFGAGFDKEFNLKHFYSDDMNVILDKFTGSKYVQSNIGTTYKQVKDFLDNDRLVLFTGTPCQVAGLKSYLGKDYDNLVCVDLVCHGVPSPFMWNKYKEYREREAKSTAKRISFRHKKYGWKRYSVLFEFANNTEYLHTLDKDMYMRAFLKDIALRPSCYNCKFKGYKRYSDMTLADFWGIEEVTDSFKDDLGTSLITLNSLKGKKIFETLNDSVKSEEVDIKKALEYNKAALKSAEKHPSRDEFMNRLKTMEFDELVDLYCKDSFSLRLKSVMINLLIKTNTFNLAKKVLKRNN